MGRPRFFRDPVHGQIRFQRLALDQQCPSDPESALSWLVPNLVNTAAFQRLRHTRQNGLSNYVFYGLEHSRFTHSIGVFHVAEAMYAAVTRNTDTRVSTEETRIGTAVSALLHDIGHGPFSHSLEEVVRGLGKPFHHEYMTVRFILEDSQVREVLEKHDPALPEIAAAYIDKKRRKEDQDHWSYRIVSSQFDADRIDYMMRDSQLAGFKGQGFDLARLLDLIYAWQNRVVIDRHATEALESYLLTLMHLYVAIYYHKGVRGATGLLLSVLRRAFDLYREGGAFVMPDNHPLAVLIEKGQDIDLPTYSRLSEFQIWSLISEWALSEDKILADLSRRLLDRRTFKSCDIDYHEQADTARVLNDIPDAIAAALNIHPELARKYYFREDKPDRTGYSAYNWISEKGDDRSIWLGLHGEEPIPIELETKNEIFKALRGKRIFPRLLYPAEVSDQVREILARA